MLIITKGKNLTVTPSMRALAERKMAKLARYAPNIGLTEVEFSVEATRSIVDRKIVQVTMERDGEILRAEERAAEMRVALDSVVDQLENQLKDDRSRERAQVRGRSLQERIVIVLEGLTAEERSIVPGGPP